jgi:rubredoxin
MSVDRCPECQFRHDEAKGSRHEGIRLGTLRQKIPENFYCPGCNVRDKQDSELETDYAEGKPF